MTQYPALADLNTCCKISYGHPLARWLLGDSFHPGGLALTTRLARLVGIDGASRVLDAGSGLGASAVHLARTVGCRVTGVTLEAEGVSAGYELADRHGVDEKVRFVQGDLRRIGLEQETFDFVLMECVLSIIPEKAAVLRHLHGLLRPGGRLGLTDVTVSGPLPQELRGLLATVGCVAGALSLSEYAALLEDHGLVVEHRQDCGAAVSSFLQEIKGKVLMVGVASELGRLPIGDGALAEGKQILAAVQEQVRRRVLGYGLLVARKVA